MEVCIIPRFKRGYPFDVQVNQATEGSVTSCDALTEMLESIENFVNRLKRYAETSQPVPAVDEIVIKLMVELISTLDLVSRKLSKRRLREFFLFNM